MSQLFAFLFIFSGSLAATATQMLLIKTLESYLHHEVLSYTLISATAFFAFAGAARKTQGEKNLPQLLRGQLLALLFTPLCVWLLLWTPAFLVMRQLMDAAMSAFLSSDYLALLLMEGLVFIFVLSRFHGFELPVIQGSQKLSLGSSLAASYGGALAGFLLVPFALVPAIGILRTAFLVSVLYAFNAIYLLRLLRRRKILFALAALIVAACVMWGQSWAVREENEEMRLRLLYASGLDVWPNEPFENLSNLFHFLKTNVQVHSEESPYQSIDWITYRNGIQSNQRLYLNMDFQFDAETEKLYHQKFLQPVSLMKKEKMRRALVLGAGDGLLCRDLLKKFPDLEKIDLVELDDQVVRLALKDASLVELNEGSLKNPKVQITIDDAFQYVQKADQKYDAVFIDLPHPNSFALSRVYSKEFYSHIRGLLAEEGLMILDAPVELAGPLLKSTLLAAGFGTQMAYGEGNTFIYAEIGNRPLDRKDLEDLKIQDEDGKPLPKANSIWNPKFPLMF